VVERALPRTSYRDGPWQAQQREARRSHRELDRTQVPGVETDV
jgi:hypothetical protein